MKYTNINIFDITMSDLIFDENDKTFRSILKLKDKTDIRFTTDNMKIKNMSDDRLTLEFLPDYPEFFKFIYDLDKSILHRILDNGQKWFGKVPKYETIDRLFQRTIIPQESILSYPIMQFIVSNKCIIKDINNEEISRSSLEENDEITCTVKIKQIIFHENRFYLDYNLEQINIQTYITQHSDDMYVDSYSMEME